MPAYEFFCPVCDRVTLGVFSMSDAPVVGEPCSEVPCDDCGLAMIRRFSSGIRVATPKPNDVYHKNPRRQAEKIAEVLDEPLTNEEIKVGRELMKERERALDKPEGTLTTGRPAPKSQKEFDERVRPVASKRAKMSKSMRSKPKGKASK